MYSPTLGRFITRDPIGSHAELYRYAGSGPITRTDSNGLTWKVSRAGQTTALAISEDGDTVDDLARIVNLDGKRFNTWLLRDRDDDGEWPETPLTTLTAGRRFRVPNTVFVGVSVNSVAHFVTGKTPKRIEEILRDKGYSVVYRDFSEGAWSADDLPTQGLYGLVYFGHGGGKGSKWFAGVFWRSQEGWLRPGGALDTNLQYGAIQPGRFPSGSLGVLLLKSCHAEEGGWGSIASDAAHDAGTVWLGSGWEVAGVDFGMTDAAAKAPGDEQSDGK